MSATHPNPRPLADLKVLELGALIAGPFCAKILAEFGAEVIKIEPPGEGDPLRKWRYVYEAKTKLPELLRQVKAGKQFTITNRGEAIADLVPSESAKPKDKSAAIVGADRCHRMRVIRRNDLHPLPGRRQ